MAGAGAGAGAEAAQARRRIPPSTVDGPVTILSAMTIQKDRADWALEFISRVVRDCPRRVAGSADVRRAQQLAEGAAGPLGLEASWQGFRFSRNLYAVNAAHMGLGVAATALSGVAPALALPMHLLAGTSYVLDSTRKAYLLRRLLPAADSQNLLLTAPAEGEPALRLVLMAHADAAHTGLMFRDDIVKGGATRAMPGVLGYLANPVILAVYSQFLLAGVDLLRCAAGPLTWPLRPLEWLLTLPNLGGLALHLELLLRDEVVPGANDDLTGVAAALLLAPTLLANKPDDVELVFVITGAEESGTGGAYHLQRAHRDRWPRQTTVALALDSLTNGQLVCFDEGELVPLSPPAWLRGAVDAAARSDPRHARVHFHRVPLGASDATPFLAAGYDAMGLGCVREDTGAPAHYHQPSDTPENLDMETFAASLDFVQRLVEQIYAARR